MTLLIWSKQSWDMISSKGWNNMPSEGQKEIHQLASILRLSMNMDGASTTIITSKTCWDTSLPHIHLSKSSLWPWYHCSNWCSYIPRCTFIVYSEVLWNVFNFQISPKQRLKFIHAKKHESSIGAKAVVTWKINHLDKCHSHEEYLWFYTDIILISPNELFIFVHRIVYICIYL